MRESYFQHVLNRHQLSFVYMVLCVGLVFAPAAVIAQQPRNARETNTASDTPLSYGTVGKMHGGQPVMYDPELLAAYYGVAPSVVSAAAQPYFAVDGQQDYEVDMTPFHDDLKPRPYGFNVGAPQQQYMTQPGQSPFRQAGAFGGLGGGQGRPQPQSVPMVSYNAPGGVSLYGRPDPYNGAGGMTFSPATPPWLTGFDAGVFANDDQVLFTLGGTVKLWEGTHSVIGTRVMANGAYYHNGPGQVGVSVDTWGATRLEVLGVAHLFKVGGLYDQQGHFHRGGFTVSGILFPEKAKAPPTFDLAFGFGSGSDYWQGRFRQVANYDAQIRLGFVFFDILRLGGSIQFWQWNSPLFDPNQTSAGGYVQLNLGQWMITGDVQATQSNAQGFLYVTWMPGRQPGPLHGCGTYNVTKTRAVERYRSWMGTAPIRDMSLRTGEPNKKRAVSAVQGPIRVGNITDVLCTVRFETADDTNMDGLLSPGESFDVDITFVNNTPSDASPTPSTTDGVLYQGIGGTTNVAVSGPAMQTGGGMSTPVTVPAGQSVTTMAAQAIAIQVDDTAVDGQNIFVEFQVIADGQIGRFRCGPTTVGTTPSPSPMRATFLNYVLPPPMP